METSRRDFLQRAAAAAGATILMPAVSSCGGRQGRSDDGALPPEARVPTQLSPNWDPIAFNRTRGNAGFIPPGYLPEVNGPSGPKAHLGKHLPYVVALDPAADGATLPDGYVALMWGDPDKGYTPHPNARRARGNGYEGHWYNWIRIRKATDGEAEELQSTYSEWPGISDDDNGAYAVRGGGAIDADAGVHTIYLAALPSGVQSGDIVRVHAHCLTHGEYVDFVRV